jgi:SMC interacting uncharacterized protein involved in chromosome segregation
MMGEKKRIIMEKQEEKEIINRLVVLVKEARDLKQEGNRMKAKYRAETTKREIELRKDPRLLPIFQEMGDIKAEI